ncbi:MAG: hypothetical protein LDLANPLL_00128 [Turneriella sp.]|nr:hypothetical protein [Turneriella sp.]
MLANIKLASGVLFFVLFFVPNVLQAAGINRCDFSLQAATPKDVHFTVQPGRVSLLCKDEAFFLRGTVTRTLPWQKVESIFDTLATELNAQTIETWDKGRLYRIDGNAKEKAKSSPQKSLLCAYLMRDSYSIDLCANEDSSTSAAQKILRKIINEFRDAPIEKMPLLKSAPISSTKRVFTSENDTREPALLALTMPAGYVEVTRRENRALFTDASGLAEIEIFYEISDLPLDSLLAHKVYKKSITAFLTQKGAWHSVAKEALEGDAPCLLFTDKDKRLSNYCYIVTHIVQNGKKKYYRIAFVTAFLKGLVHDKILLAEQQSLLKAWVKILNKHSD